MWHDVSMYGPLVKRLREENKVTQEQLANLIGVSRPTLTLLESEDKELTISQAKIICDHFQISLESFLRGDLKPSVEVNLEASTVEIDQDRETLRISVPQEKIAVFKEVLLYILNKVGGKPNVGQTVLYKLLYFIDFDFYEKFEEQLIGAKYIRNHHGPTPVEFKKIISQMIEDNDIEEVKSEFFSYSQTKYLPRKKADLSIISGSEKEHIDAELDRLSDLTATELSDLSHKDVPWITALQGEILDYEAVFYRTSETSQRAPDEAEL